MNRRLLLILALILVLSCAKKDKRITSIVINGVSYPVVVIGSKTWMAADYQGPGAEEHPVPALNATAFLYNYRQAAAIAPPRGWRRPSAADYSQMLQYIGGGPDGQGFNYVTDSVLQKLVVPTGLPGLSGNNATHFSAIPVGFHLITFPGYSDATDRVGYWTSTSNGHFQYSLLLEAVETNNTWSLYGGLSNGLTSDALCIRFVKDN